MIVSTNVFSFKLINCSINGGHYYYEHHHHPHSHSLNELKVHQELTLKMTSRLESFHVYHPNLIVTTTPSTNAGTPSSFHGLGE